MGDQLREFFREREICITGGSGFLGKGLIEKILHSFNVKRIYLLMREKKGELPAKRLEELKNDKIFDVLRKIKPNELQKLVPIAGDISQLNLALSSDSIELLQNVSIVLHSAATIRFDEPLKTAILINVRGTREVLRLAGNLPKLQIFLHISTLFSNCNRKYIDEKIYPSPADWRSCIKIAEHSNEDCLRLLSNKFTQGFPNTYTFTKALSEHVVNDFRQTVPIVIIRPSIVLCALFDPVPGYTDNMAGSTSIAVAGGAGLLRTLLCDPDMTPNQVPLDLVTRITILSIWKASSYQQNRLPFICNVSGEIFPEFSIRSQLTILRGIWRDFPYGKMFWKPSVHPTSCEAYFLMRLLFTQLIPAVMGDTCLRLGGHKPVLVKFQRNIFSAIQFFQFFLASSFKSGMSNMVMLMEESEKFNGFETKTEFVRDPVEYAKTVAMSCRRFILKEDDLDLPRAKRLYKWLWLADTALKAVLFFALIFVLLSTVF